MTTRSTGMSSSWSLTHPDQAVRGEARFDRLSRRPQAEVDATETCELVVRVETTTT